MVDSGAHIRISNLTHTYPGSRRSEPRTALQDVSLDIHAGEMVALLGPNGSGKSTTLGIVLNVVNKSSGDFAWFGGGTSTHEALKKVGAIIVKNRMIISDGYNGAPSGFDNCCEDKEGQTHWYVLHAEANAILKIAGSNHDCSGATLYLTMSPCNECSKLVHQAGIKRLVYLNGYKDTSGLDFLENAGVEIKKLKF